MFCDKCGSEASDDSEFCRKCGRALNTAQPTAAGSDAGVASASAAQRKWRIAIWLLVPVLVFGIWWFATPTNSRHGSSPLGQLTAQQYAEPLPQTSFTVNALSYNAVKFEVPASSFDVSVVGRVGAAGGSGNDIEVYVLSEDAYVNWQNRHNTSSFYNSGRMTQVNLNVSLPPNEGTYYIVFNNRFSMLSPKAVEANVTLHYKK
jgi:hypothetical protein